MGFRNNVKKVARPGKQVTVHFNGMEYKGTVKLFEMSNPNDATITLESEDEKQLIILPISQSMVVLSDIENLEVPTEEPDKDTDDYNTWTLAELKDELTERKIPFSKNVKKGALIRAIESSDEELVKQMKVDKKKKRKDKKDKKDKKNK